MGPFSCSPELELWGGIECTVNRVGEQTFDQLVFSGHDRRPEDLDRVAALGLRTLRYPVLWERVAPEAPDRHDWMWTDSRLSRLRQLGISPVVGLVHHGSGPRYTGLLDPGFAPGLADFAGSVARRYPWVDRYTPVNEPLTTARFSALYGHWYPHLRDDRAFMRALLNQCRAVVLAMRAIRQVQPEARLIQTEDLGKTHSTAALRYQADFENQRRWLTYDLLCGRVDRHHPLGSFFLHLGLPEIELGWFQDNPCPPDVVGVNYYLTSERFLDEHRERYPPCCHGSNGRHLYADVEAVRVGERAGPEGVLREAWQRYGLPLVVTEVHLGCTREEQMRWLLEVWHAAGRLRLAGADLCAVTAWSLLGALDWDSLVTRRRGHYEPGAFDIRGGQARPTALARLIRELATGQEPAHPVLDVPGWWRRPERICYPRQEVAASAVPHEAVSVVAPPASTRRSRLLLITGASGTLGRAFGRICVKRGLPYQLLSRREMDIASPTSVAQALAGLSPWAVVNAAGYVRVDDAERDPQACRRENALGAAVLAEACAEGGLPLLTFSSDLVFDGRQGAPYREADRTNPLGVYGWSKVEAEAAVRRIHPRALVVRTSAFFGPWDEQNFLTLALQTLARGSGLAAADDLTISPTYVPDLVHACLDLLIDGEEGLWHLTNQGAVTWWGLARAAARGAGLDENQVQGRPAAAFGWAAPRPAYSALGSERGGLLPDLDSALARYLRERPTEPVWQGTS